MYVISSENGDLKQYRYRYWDEGYDYYYWGYQYYYSYGNISLVFMTSEVIDINENQIILGGHYLFHNPFIGIYDYDLNLTSYRHLSINAEVE